MSVLGTLVRWLRDVDLAEDALHDSVVAAWRSWPRDGEPSNPAGWLVRVAHNAAIDWLRREGQRAQREQMAARWNGQPAGVAGADPAHPYAPVRAIGELDEVTIVDDQLRLLFLCCHPALAPDTQVALTLRSIAGLTTTEIAHGFLVPEPTMAQRMVRAKKKIRAAGIPFVLPEPEDLAERRDQVLHTVYLVFNEGYAATAGDEVVRRELCAEAIRLARVIVTLMPTEPEALGLLALLVLQDSRRETRVDDEGDLVLLAEQDRARWDHAQVDEGVALVERALGVRRVGPYQLEAAIAALHATAPSWVATDWAQIAALYGVLMRVAPSP